MEFVALACSCGVTYESEVPAYLAAAFRKSWDAHHRGPGHVVTPAPVVRAVVADRHAFTRSLETGDWGA